MRVSTFLKGNGSQLKRKRKQARLNNQDLREK